jgi:putative phosphoesterase
MNPIAIISDIHGNSWAFDAVLADITRRGIREIVNLGDHFYGPLDPHGVAERLLKLNIPSVRGNQDRILIEPEPPDPPPTLTFTKRCLDRAHLDWIAAQPCTIEYRGVLLCHGSPANDTDYLAEQVTLAGVYLRNAILIANDVAAIEESILACGHTHIPRVIRCGEKLIINPGSVGLQAYSDDLPYPHSMQTGSPHARYAILSDAGVELIALAYDWDAPAAAALANGREDWAHALKTGWALRA